MSKSFNLIDEPWIVVVDIEGATREASIAEILCDSETLVTVGGDIPTQQFAITRMLIAIIHRAVDWRADPITRWGEIWKAGKLPEPEIRRYLSSVHHRFNLLDDTEPFYQVSDFTAGKSGPRPIGLLVADLPAGSQYFTTRAGEGAATLTLAEAARWVVHTQAFDASGIKTGDPSDPRTKGGRGYPMGIAWAGQLGGVLMEGKTLVETLLLNTIVEVSDQRWDPTEDLPTWERPHPTVAARSNPKPTGPIDLLTWQSRRIRIIYDDDHAVAATVGNGDLVVAYEQQYLEHYTGWRKSDKKSQELGQDTYYPMQFDVSRAVWQGLEGLLIDLPDKTSGMRRYAPVLVNWINRVTENRFLALDDFVTPHVFGIRYDTQASVIGASIDDRIRMRVANFGNDKYRGRAVTAARSAEAIANAMGALARDLAVAAGGEGQGEMDAARSRVLAAADIPYRRWLLRLGVDDTDELVTAWEKKLLDLGRGIATEFISTSGRPAFVGREVTNSRGQTYRMDSPTAQRNFWSAMRRELTTQFPAERELDHA